MSKLRWGILGAARVNERLLPAIVEASTTGIGPMIRTAASKGTNFLIQHQLSDGSK